MSFFIFLNITYASQTILVEQYENWKHPVIAIFKKYKITLCKVSYSKNGIYPTFYAKFRLCFLTHKVSRLGCRIKNHDILSGITNALILRHHNAQ